MDQQEAQRNVLMPCDNGQSYSVSQNQIVHLPGPDNKSSSSSPTNSCTANNCKHTTARKPERKGLVLNLTNQFEAASSKPSSPSSDSESCKQQQQQQLQGISPIVENGHDDSTTESSDGQSQSNYYSYPSVMNFNLFSMFANKRLISGSNGESLVWTASEVKCIHTNNSDRVGGGLDQSCSESDSSSTTLTSQQQQTGRKPKREGDPFSTQVDRVFDREERREPQAQVRESPSRQSSWSSYDSAVVMDNNSVHSSWATLPSRNSSWGSYDMRPADSLGSSGLFPYDREEIPWHPGTVKRTKQKLEESSTGTNIILDCILM